MTHLQQSAELASDHVEGPIKSEIDKQHYRTISLENGLKALLIQDSTADKAAAAMDVSFENITGITSASLACRPVR